MSMRGSFIRGMVSTKLKSDLKGADVCSDAPADVMESDSKFVSGEKPVLKTDSHVNK